MKKMSFIGVMTFGFLMLVGRTSSCMTEEEARTTLNVVVGASSDEIKKAARILATAIQKNESSCTKERYLEAFALLEKAVGSLRWECLLGSDDADGNLDLTGKDPSTIVRLKSDVKIFKASVNSPYLQFLHLNKEIKTLDLSHFSNLCWLIGNEIGSNATPSKSLVLDSLKSDNEIPLKRLALNNSSINFFDLSSYPLLEEVELNCSDKLQCIYSSKDLDNLKKIIISNANWSKKIDDGDEEVDSKTVFSTIDLSKYKNLEEIDLSNNVFLTEITTGVEFSSVKKLLLARTGIKKLDLTFFPNLEELDVANCDQLTHIVSRGTLHKLKQIKWMKSSLERLELSECTALEEIFITSPEESLRVIQFSGAMPALKTLSVIKKSKIPFLKKILVLGIEKCSNSDFKRADWMLVADENSLTHKIFDLGNSLEILREKLKTLKELFEGLKASMIKKEA